jgi:hypothetical protein
MPEKMTAAEEEQILDMLEELEKKYHDYNLFREYLINAAMEDKFWHLEETTPLSEWASELVKESNLDFDYNEAYVEYNSGELIIDREGCKRNPDDCDNNLVFYPTLWHVCFLRALDHLDYDNDDEEEIITDKNEIERRLTAENIPPEDSAYCHKFTAKQAFRILEKVIALAKEVEAQNMQIKRMKNNE